MKSCIIHIHCIFLLFFSIIKIEILSSNVFVQDRNEICYFSIMCCKLDKLCKRYVIFTHRNQSSDSLQNRRSDWARYSAYF